MQLCDTQEWEVRMILFNVMVMSQELVYRVKHGMPLSYLMHKRRICPIVDCQNRLRTYHAKYNKLNVYNIR